MNQPKSSRLPQIDGLRAFAAITVMLFHYSSRFDQIFVHSAGAPFSFVLGSRGVELFFVISGFVIFMTLDATKHALEFAVARLGRLYPTYWLAVILTTLVAAAATELAPGMLLDVRHLLANMTMVHGLFGFSSADGVYWSLEIELLYYMWMLLIACMGWLKRIEWVLLAWLAVCLIDAGLISAGKDIVPYTFRHIALLKWLPWFALGMIVYRIYQAGRLHNLQALVLALALASIAVRTEITDILFAAAWLLLVGLAAFGRLPIAGWRVMTFLGAISYPLYLVHQQIGYVVMLWLQRAGATPLVTIAAAGVIAVILAWGLHRLIEKPSMRMVSRWRARRAAATQASANSSTGTMPAQPSIASWPWTIACLVLIGSLTLGSVVAGKVNRAKRLASETEHLATVKPLEPGSLENLKCPDFKSGTAAPVLLVLGQSNAASHAGPVNPDESIHLIAGGQCYESIDPLPGTSGDQASLWTALDREWTAQKNQSRPWFSVLAVGASTMKQWTESSQLRDIYLKKLKSLASHGVQPSAILWQQGEADMRLGTAANDWLAGLSRLRADLDAVGFMAPLIVAQSTYCRMAGSGAIARGLEQQVASGQLPDRVLLGPDTDSLPEDHRRDTCHFNTAGREAAARMWHEALQPLTTGQNPQ